MAGYLTKYRRFGGPLALSEVRSSKAMTARCTFAARAVNEGAAPFAAIDALLAPKAHVAERAVFNEGIGDVRIVADLVGLA